MAIILEVDDYCDDCPSFSPEMKKFRSEDLNLDRHVQTVVFCENHYICGRVARIVADKSGKNE